VVGLHGEDQESDSPRALGPGTTRVCRCNEQGPFVVSAAPRAAGRGKLWRLKHGGGGEIFHPLRWQPSAAMQLLREVPQLESAGVVVRMPAAWRANLSPERRQPLRFSACPSAARTLRASAPRLNGFCRKVAPIS